MMRRRKSKFSGNVILGVLLLGMLDLMSNTAATGLLTSAIAIPHINRPPKDIAEKRVPTLPVALFVQVRWPDDYPHDIDMWVTCSRRIGSEDLKTIYVNFRQRSDGWLDLNRDDLGRPSVLNEENVKSNSVISTVPPSTFCRINVHLYHSHDGMLPLPGTFVVIVNKDSEQEQAIASLEFLLRFPGEEITLLTLEWDEKSVVIPETVQTYPEVETKNIATEPDDNI